MSIKEYRMGKCNFVLPTVFNDALSYYEALCQICEKTNEIVDTINDMQENLPIKPATATVLGGILADPATTDDTTPVLIGEDHKLYTHFTMPELNIENGEGEHSLVQTTRHDDNSATGYGSCAFNGYNTCTALDSTAFGYNNVNHGELSLVEGSYNTLYGNSMHIEGSHNTMVEVLGVYSKFGHIEGYGNDYQNEYHSHVEGFQCVVSGNMGNAGLIPQYVSGNTYHNGDVVSYSGRYFMYNGDGFENLTSTAPNVGDYYIEDTVNPWVELNTNHAEGDTCAIGNSGICHSEGKLTGTDCAISSHTEGYDTHVDPVYAKPSVACGHAEGNKTYCTDWFGHSEGTNTVCHGVGSHIEGVSGDVEGLNYINENEFTNEEIIEAWENYDVTYGTKFAMTRGIGAHVEGANGLGLGNHCHVEGNGCIATNNSGHAEGTGSRALGKYSHAGGLESIAKGGRSFAHGDTCEANGDYSFAINRGTKANANYTFVGGRNTEAKKQYGFGYGYNVVVENQYGTVFGYQTTSNPNTDAQFVCGKWNKRTSGTTDYDLLVVGCGSSSTQDNAFSTGVRSETKYIKIGSTELTEAQLTSLLALI